MADETPVKVRIVRLSDIAEHGGRLDARYYIDNEIGEAVPTVTDKNKLRYIELSYELPDDDQSRFWATIVTTPSPNAAVEEATVMFRRHNPKAVRIEEFMQRVVTPDKAAKIEAAMRDGTWEGWKFGPSGTT